MTNVFDLEVEYPDDNPAAFARGRAQLSPLIGAEQLGATLYELPPETSVCPYHYEYGREEWLLVLDGEPTVRTPGGERRLRRGDLLCFPSGAEGAHAVIGPGRMVLFSSVAANSIVVYPDSDKIGSRPADSADNLNFRRSDAVDYWEGE